MVSLVVTCKPVAVSLCLTYTKRLELCAKGEKKGKELDCLGPFEVEISRNMRIERGRNEADLKELTAESIQKLRLFHPFPSSEMKTKGKTSFQISKNEGKIDQIETFLFKGLSTHIRPIISVTFSGFFSIQPNFTGQNDLISINFDSSTDALILAVEYLKKAGLRTCVLAGPRICGPWIEGITEKWGFVTVTAIWKGYLHVKICYFAGKNGANCGYDYRKTWERAC